MTGHTDRSQRRTPIITNPPGWIEARMTDGPQGPGWWQAADLKWYPPEKRPDPAALPPPPAADAAQQQPADSTLAATPTPQQGRKPAKTRQVIERDKLGVLSKIGQGGQGVVYRAPNVKTKFAASMVYKEYKLQARTEIDFTALAAMPALVEESLTYSQAERLISIAAWPCAIIDDAGTPTGFVMPAIPEEFFIPLTTVKGVSTSTAEFQHLLNHPTVLAARGITLDDAQRFTLLRETASALVFLHKHRVCVGDISPKNLLFSLTPHEAVYFIDCDAMRINTISALPQVETPGWNTPPGEELATIYTDTYKLGLLALRLLTGDHDTTNPQHLPSTTPTQLRQIITDTLTNPPHQRPLPEAWTSVLGHAIEQAQHQKKTTPPVSAALAPPPTPIVRSRPPVHTAPPVRPSAPPVPQPRPADRPPPQAAPTTLQLWWQRQRRPGLILAIVVILAAAGITAAIVHTNQQRENSNRSQITLPTSTQHREPAYGPQVVLPFTGLDAPVGAAVDTAGNLYITDNGNSRVLKLAAGSTTQSVLPFTGLNNPEGVAVDAAGDLYVADWGNNRVVELAAGSSTQSVLPFTGLNLPFGVAVDAAGDLYVADSSNNRVLELAAGSSTQAVLPFTGLNGPGGVAVDAAGSVYVTDVRNNQVLTLGAGSTTQSVLPFTGLNNPEGVAVDAAGPVYVTNMSNHRVLKLPAG
jgi:serine/threonine protein kinase/sugar lactone lactonase YvrE